MPGSGAQEDETRDREQKQTICQNEQHSPLVRKKIDACRKYLKTLERVKGIEPSSSAWKAVALPLSYTRAGNSRQTSVTRSLRL